MVFKDKNINWSLVIAFFALVVSIIVAVSQCNQTEDMQALEYKVNQIQYNPKISIIDTPFVKDFSLNIPKYIARKPIIILNKRIFVDTSLVKLDTNSIKQHKIGLVFQSKKAFDSVMSEMRIRSLGIDSLNINIDSLKFTVKTSIKLKNVGNALAKIYLYSLADTNSGYPELRDDFIKMVNNKRTNFKYHYDLMNEYFQNELLPGKSINIPIEYKVRNINRQNKVNLHFYFVYENELGDVYDTYYWIVYKNFPDLIRPEYSYNTNLKKLMVRFQLKSEAKHILQVSEIKESYNNYSRSFSEKFEKWINEKAQNANTK